MPLISVIIPAYNEENSIQQVIRHIPANLVAEVIVVNNNSTDKTAEKALQAGATVLLQTAQGYGNACLKGLEYLQAKPVAEQPEIVVFLDGDYSDYPEKMPELVLPIINDQADLVIGSRALGFREKGS